MYDSQEAEHPAKPPLAFHAAVAESEGDEETSGSRARVDQQAAKRARSEADCCQTDARASRLGELFPDGKRRPGVQQDGLFCGDELATLAVSAGWATANKTGSIHRRDRKSTRLNSSHMSMSYA